MAESICSKEEVYSFIDEVQAKLILNEIDNLTIVPRKDKKTQNCMAELKLRHKEVSAILKNLEISNYAHTRDDDNERYKGQKLRVFGYDYDGVMLYIKIVIRKKVILVSFHPQEYELTYPYK